MSNVEDVAAAPKTEHSEEGSFSDTSPEVDEQNFVPENAQVQKRKGGRKPVRDGCPQGPDSVLNPFRFMPLRKKESREIVKPKPHSESAGQSTLSS